MPIMRAGQIHKSPQEPSLPQTNDDASSVSMVTDKASQDVFLLVHDDETKSYNHATVTLVPSKHAGHQFFRCLAELNKLKFVKEFKKDVTTRHVASSLVASLCNNGRGRIYIRYTSISDQKWRPIRKSRQAAELIFKVLLNMYKLKATPDTAPEVVPLSPIPSVITVEPTSWTKLQRIRNEKKRSLENDLEAAEGLLLVREGSLSDSSIESRLEDDRLPPKKRVRFSHNVVFDDLHTKSPDSQAKKTFSTLMKNSPTRATPLFHPDGGRVSPDHHGAVRRSSGIPLWAITESDVLCGGSGKGVLSTSNLGNLRFHALIDENVVDFYTYRSDKRRMLGLAKLAVKSVHAASPPGRFLVANPSSGLWHEVKPEKAWSKALRTFQTYTDRQFLLAANAIRQHKLQQQQEELQQAAILSHLMDKQRELRERQMNAFNGLRFNA